MTAEQVGAMAELVLSLVSTAVGARVRDYFERRRLLRGGYW